ncbi:MAG: hypothetical protein E7394_02245 [Ruminococcaceae bacterium]|nr:hypothetical protein [Oscillospiraceae bacterium]
MKKIAAHNCICQNCQKVFPVNEMMYSVINLDENAEKTREFDMFEINKVTCPKCKSSFTFELPLLICSKRLKVAIYVNSSPSPDKHYKSKAIPIWLITDYKIFRKCLYYAEAVEKFRIFRDELNDKIIEYLKLCRFNNTDALPFDEINLLYSHNDGVNLYFDKIDFNNNIIKTYSIPMSDIKEISNEIKFNRSHNTWQTVNRLTIKDFII